MQKELIELIEIIKKINSKSILPETCLRRNSVLYNLVTYVNHTIAFLTADSYNNIPIFVYRARKELDRLLENNLILIEDPYYVICEEYLVLLSQFLLKSDVLEENEIELLTKL